MAHEWLIVSKCRNDLFFLVQQDHKSEPALLLLDHFFLSIRLVETLNKTLELRFAGYIKCGNYCPTSAQILETALSKALPLFEDVHLAHHL